MAPGWEVHAVNCFRRPPPASVRSWLAGPDGRGSEMIRMSAKGGRGTRCSVHSSAASLHGALERGPQDRRRSQLAGSFVTDGFVDEPRAVAAGELQVMSTPPAPGPRRCLRFPLPGCIRSMLHPVEEASHRCIRRRASMLSQTSGSPTPAPRSQSGPVQRKAPDDRGTAATSPRPAPLSDLIPRRLRTSDRP